MQLAIISGSSRGLGLELARECIKKNIPTLGISRQASAANLQLDSAKRSLFKTLDWDLTELDDKKFESAVQDWLKDFSKINAIWLFHAAATPDPLGELGSLQGDQIIRGIQMNVSTSIQLLNSFIHLTQNLKVKKSAILISSGAAETPIRGASIYCASKAAMEAFARVTREEQKSQKYPIGICIVRPGIFESAMQDQLRSSSIPDKDLFVKFKNENRLKGANEVALKILQRLFENYELPNEVHF